MTKKNEKFWKLSKPEKRVAIAKDVLKSLKVGMIQATEGIYISPYNIYPEDHVKLDKFFKEQKHCQVCALGSCFVSLVNLGDNLTVKDVSMKSYVSGIKYISEDEFRPLLEKIFTPNQLSLIESAFECSYMINESSTLLRHQLESCIRFGKKYKDSKSRLIAIMQNIIKNEGTFKS